MTLFPYPQNPQEAKQNVYFLHCAGGISGYNYFGMADMFIRSQILQAQQESGNWHIAIKNISNEEAAIIASRPDIEVFSPYGVLNYRGDLGYTLGGKDVAICGCDESYITEIWTDQLEEGVFHRQVMKRW